MSRGTSTLCGDRDATDNILEYGGREQCLVSLLFAALPLSPRFGASSPISDRDPVLCQQQAPDVTGTTSDVEEEWSPGQPREPAVLFMERRCLPQWERVWMEVDPLSKRFFHFLPVYCNRESNFWSTRCLRLTRRDPHSHRCVVAL